MALKNYTFLKHEMLKNFYYCLDNLLSSYSKKSIINLNHNSCFWSLPIRTDDLKFALLKCYMERAVDYVMRDIRCTNIGLIFEKAHHQLTLREVIYD